MKLRELRLRKGLKAKELGLQVGLGEDGISRLENYHFLPIPPVMDRICKVLDVTPSDIYDKREMTYAFTAPRKQTNNDVYNFQAKLPKEWRVLLRKAVKELGYKGVADWFLVEARKLIEGECENARHQ